MSTETRLPLDLDPGELSLIAQILESFTETLDLPDVLRRVVQVTLDAFGASRAWLLAPVGEKEETATVVFEATAEGYEGAMARGEVIPLESFRPYIRRVRQAGRPLAGRPGDPGIDTAVLDHFGVRTQLVQILQTRDGREWGFGMHQCDRDRQWSDAETRLFGLVGRYATLAINNALLHRKAVEEAAILAAVLNEIPESAVVFDVDGVVIRSNRSAGRHHGEISPDPEIRVENAKPRRPDGRVVAAADVPSVRALRGEHVTGDYIFYDHSEREDRIHHVTASPVHDEDGNLIGAVALTRDVTEARLQAEQEKWRRRRAETLGTLTLDLVGVATDFTGLQAVAERVGKGMQANVSIFFYSASSDLLDLAASFSLSEGAHEAMDHASRNPFKPGEGLVGAVFQIGQPMLFADPQEGALPGYGRSDEERELIALVREQGVIACPIEAFGERIGVLVLGHLDEKRTFKAEDLSFALSVSERIAAAYHIHQLNRLSTEGHRAAEDLARREVDARARLEAVLESAPIGIAVVSADELRFEIANRVWIEFAQRFGKIGPETDVTGLRVAEVIPNFEPILAQAGERNEVRIEEDIPVRQHGQIWYYDRIISPVRGRFSGVPQSLTVLIQDVTESVRSKQEIEALVRMMEERTARLDSILGSMTDALWVFDREGDVVDVNRAALSMFGLASQSDAVARGSFTDFRLRYPDGRVVPTKDLPHNRALRGEIVPDLVAVGSHLLTERDMDLSFAAAPIRSGGSVVGAILVVRDISALQELDRKKDEFLSVASHELRTPLTTIRGYAQLLTQMLFEIGPAERATYLKSMLSEIDRMMGLITELLDVSRIQRNRLQVHPQDLDWVEFVRRLVEEMAMQHAGRSIEFHAREQNVRLPADPQRMRQVIDNLISNALKYSPDGSLVEVSLERGPDSVVTRIKDRGIGIPEDELPHLFERFHRAHNVSSRYYGGLGLGLYISKAIVAAHGGVIEVETAEGTGSTFSVVLPLKIPPES
jgi:signal transduction histidine kinase/GAF domain-containing protein